MAYFWRGLYSEGLIYGGKSIGLALRLEVNLPFLLYFTLYLRAIFQVQAPGGLIFGGAIYRRVFLRYEFEGLIFGGAYFRTLTVFLYLVRFPLSSSLFWELRDNES